MTLIKSHRAIGLELERTEKHVIVETSQEPGSTLALPLVTTQPATLDDVRLQLRFELSDIVRKAQFLGLDLTGIQSVIADELSNIAKHP